MSRDAVQAIGQVAYIHLCKIVISALIPRPLLLAVALHVLGPGDSVIAPVVGIALRPRLLGGALVDPVVGVGLELCPLPMALAGALAVGRGAVGLVGSLRAWRERFATAGTASCHRQGLHAKGRWKPRRHCCCAKCGVAGAGRCSHGGPGRRTLAWLAGPQRFDYPTYRLSVRCSTDRAWI